MRQLWTTWHEFIVNHPDHAFRPRRVEDEDTALRIWALATNEPDWLGMVVIHPWRIPKAAPSDPWLQPPPYDMGRTLEDARSFLPASATLVQGLPIADRYVEVWWL